MTELYWLVASRETRGHGASINSVAGLARAHDSSNHGNPALDDQDVFLAQVRL
jgi:hypothetical protein